MHPASHVKKPYTSKNPLPATPLVSIFGAKAAPAYTIAKDIIHALLTLSKVIAADPVVSKYLQVVFVDYSPRCQMSLLYSAIVRSLLNRPALAMLMTHFLRQPSGSQA